MFIDSVYEMTLLIKKIFFAIDRPFKKPVWSLSTQFCKTAVDAIL